MSFLKEKPRIIPMVMRGCCCPIIPYQEIIGNYSLLSVGSLRNSIIPYQEITGNYSCQGWYGILESLSIPQNKKIPLLRII